MAWIHVQGLSRSLNVGGVGRSSCLPHVLTRTALATNRAWRVLWNNLSSTTCPCVLRTSSRTFSSSHMKLRVTQDTNYQLATKRALVKGMVTTGQVNVVLLSVGSPTSLSRFRAASSAPVVSFPTWLAFGWTSWPAPQFSSLSACPTLLELKPSPWMAMLWKAREGVWSNRGALWLVRTNTTTTYQTIRTLVLRQQGPSEATTSPCWKV